MGYFSDLNIQPKESRAVRLQPHSKPRLSPCPICGGEQAVGGKQMTEDRWIKRWTVPSGTNPDKTYTVAQDRDGSYGCSCPAWKFQRKRLKDGKCKHIRQVEAGRWPEAGGEIVGPPEFILANVRQVTPVHEGEKVTAVHVPLIPIGDTHFQATVVYDLLRYGFSWGYLKKRYEIAKRNSRKALVEYVRTRGRCIYGPVNALGRFDGQRHLPVPLRDGL